MSPYELIDGVAVITLSHPPLNTLALPLRRRLSDTLDLALADPAVQAIVLRGDGRAFCGGGDITEFDSPACSTQPTPPTLFDQIEAAPKPVVAAMHGFALGGGLELALACHGRVAHPTTQVGLPEVHLGLIPGAGGTQRLPRLVGVERALDMVVRGTTQAAAGLAESGLFDIVIPAAADAVEAACALARRWAGEDAQTLALRRTGALPCAMENLQAFTAFARSTVKSPPGAPTATLDCIDCVEAAALLPFREGLAREAAAFDRLRHSEGFAGLRHVFLAERAVTTVRDLPAGTAPRALQRVAVIGGGTMGSGIAIALANAGLSVLLVERDAQALERALAGIRDHYDTAAQRRKLSAETAAARRALVAGTVELAAAAQADLFIEAVFEDLQVKREVFEHLDAIARPGAILATNTSMLDVDTIAAFTNRPADVLGLHFFSPAHVMKLLEVVRGARTAPDVLASGVALGRRLGKMPVVSGVCEGFIGNRMVEAYLAQAGLLLDEGALPHQVDQAMERWGMAMGPFRMSDLAGNDVGAKIRAARLATDPSRVYSGVNDAIVRLGRFGQKVGRGWYDHVPGQRQPLRSAEVEAEVVAASAALGLQRRDIPDAEIVDRLLLALANEGFKILDEGIAQRASDIDVVYTAGYGFPRWRGGPMFAVERRGFADAAAAMRRYARGPAYQRAASFWQPAPLLERLAHLGGSLYAQDTPEAA
jgi:3-hydroxyacyl-CoA dehydrogenase